MVTAIAISVLTCAAMILAVLFVPKLRIGKISLGSYWVATIIGALLLLLTGSVRLDSVLAALLADTAINPLKILVLFISMALLSIFLDELGFFRYLASVCLHRAGKSQMRLFVILYVTVSVLTVFTSNDIIILSFTPFICYFAKHARVSPMPYLAAEFVAANTWSMALIIGNPTNVYLVTAAGGDFLSYLRVMLLPTLAAGATAFVCLLLLFRKRLREPIEAHPEPIELRDKLSLWVGLLHLGACTVALAVGSYVGLEMWLVSLLSAVSLFAWVLCISAARRKRPTVIGHCLHRAPWELIHFILSMFVLVEALNQNGVTDAIRACLGSAAPVWTYGATSFLGFNAANSLITSSSSNDSTLKQRISLSNPKLISQSSFPTPA